MKIADMKVTELINEIGLGTPAPGGGAVAGLAGGGAGASGGTIFPCEVIPLG